MKPTRRPIAILLQVVGLATFLASLPLDVLSGSGRGFLADPGDFQGWEVVYLGFMGSWLIVRHRELNGAAFLPIMLTSIFTILAPCLNLLSADIGPRASVGLRSTGTISLVMTALFVLSWGISDGVCYGAVAWLGGAAMVVCGVLYQPGPAPMPSA